MENFQEEYSKGKRDFDILQKHFKFENDKVGEEEEEGDEFRSKDQKEDTFKVKKLEYVVNKKSINWY